MAKARKPSHPGEILLKEYLEPSNISIADFAKHVGLSEKVVSNLIDGKTKLDLKKAHRFAKSLGTSVEFWAQLQLAFDLAALKADKELAAEVRSIKKLKLAALAA